MTSTSFKSCQTLGCKADYRDDDVDCATAMSVEAASTGAVDAALVNRYAAETLRMKAFASRRKFQAPVADDFVRGMFAPGHPEHPDATLQRQTSGVWAALINALTAWWRRQKAG